MRLYKYVQPSLDARWQSKCWKFSSEILFPGQASNLICNQSLCLNAFSDSKLSGRQSHLLVDSSNDQLIIANEF